MKITLFTSNKSRHNFFINLLSEIATELFVIQECGTIFTGIVPGHYPATPSMKKYFLNVNNAQLKYFGNTYIENSKNNIRLLPIQYGDLNKCSLEIISDFLKSDIYIVFGSSYIKDELAKYLIKADAINIHAGVSPYYKGTDCNFWALYDDNYHLVGSTIHLLTEGLDSGPILYHAMSTLKTNPFEYTMSTIKSAFHSIAERIKDRSIFNIKPIIQDKKNEIKYSKKNEFTDTVIEHFFKKEINLHKRKFDNSLLINPYFLEK